MTRGNNLEYDEKDLCFDDQIFETTTELFDRCPMIREDYPDLPEGRWIIEADSSEFHLIY